LSLNASQIAKQAKVVIMDKCIGSPFQKTVNMVEAWDQILKEGQADAAVWTAYGCPSSRK
jgi:hypothetical protein